MSTPANLRASRLLLAACGLLPWVAMAQSVQVTPLCDCAVSSMAADGQAATGTMSDDHETFRWTAKGGVKRLGRNIAQIGLVSGSAAISADGKVVASTILSDDGTVSTQGLWTQGSGWRQLSPPLPPDGGNMDGEDSSVYGLSGDGKVVTGLYWRPGMHDGSAHGSVWAAETGMVGLPTAGASARIDSANADGSLLSGWESHPVNGYRQAAVWRQGVKTILTPEDRWGEASYLNQRGNIVVGMELDPATSLSSAALWKWNGSQWVKSVLGVLKGTNSYGMAYATGVSENGKVAVGLARRSVGPTSTGFVWNQGKLKEAADFFAAYGYSDPDHSIIHVPAVSPDGKTFAVMLRQRAAPFTLSSVLIRIVPA